ncbi:MAG: hypothetical protein Q7S21_06960 [archaeon]|nr:hypothetical protein [archaeon]
MALPRKPNIVKRTISALGKTRVGKATVRRVKIVAKRQLSNKEMDIIGRLNPGETHKIPNSNIEYQRIKHNPFDEVSSAEIIPVYAVKVIRDKRNGSIQFAYDSKGNLIRANKTNKKNFLYGSKNEVREYSPPGSMHYKERNILKFKK